MNQYLPEGELSARGRACPENLAETEEYIKKGIIAEAICILCDSEHNLIADMGFIKGLIPRNEGAVGIEDGSTRDIALISRVNKPVAFKITGIGEGAETVLLSRRLAQLEALENYIDTLAIGDVIDAKVTHLEPFGAFVDIGCGIASLIPIDLISVSRISHPSDRFFVGQNIKAAVKSRDNGKITLTHKELLGTWEQNASLFSAGETVRGTVRSIESYGIFVELRPNLAGLAELRPGISVGSTVSVYIKAVIPEKMKIKLIIVDSFGVEKDKPPENEYFISSGRLDTWRYSPDCSEKLIESRFSSDDQK